MNLMLQGQVVEDSSFGLRREIGNLQVKIRELQDELNQARREKESALASVRNLQEILAPLYRSLGGIFGEIAASGVSPDASSATERHSNSKRPAVWEKWVQKFGGHKGAFLQVLLDHGPSNARQLMVGMGINRIQTVYNTANELSKLSLVRKNGEMYQLVE